MIINIPPQEPSQAIQGKSNYMLWMRSPTKPETNNTVNWCMEEAKKHPHKYFISIEYGSHEDFCKRQKLRNIGDVCRIKNKKAVFEERNPNKETVIKQMSLLEESETERIEDDGEVAGPSTSIAKISKKKAALSVDDYKNIFRSICESARPGPCRALIPLKKETTEQQTSSEPRIETGPKALAIKSRLPPRKKVRLNIRQRVNSESQPGGSHQPSTSSASLGRPYLIPRKKDLCARKKNVRK